MSTFKVRGLVAGVVLGALVAVACSSDAGNHASNSSSPAPTTTTTNYTPVFAKGSCNDEVPSDPRIECGTLTVPEDRSKPDGRKVVMPVATVHTANPSPAPDPVVYLEGGPGYPGLAKAERFLTKGFAGNRDVILLDQRGTGQSVPNLDCPEVHEANAVVEGDVQSFDVEDKIYSDALLACRDRIRASGVDLNQYNTTAVADDVADLRTAMGIQEWNLYGVSYGTTVALATMRAHPEGVRSVVVDSVFPTDVGISVAEEIASFERVERVFFDGCAKDARCHGAFPTLEADFAAVLQALDAAPYRTTIDNPTLKRRTPFTVAGGDTLSGFFQALYDSDLIAQLPGIIEQLKAGTGGPIIDELAVRSVASLDGAAEAQSMAVNCSDRASSTNVADDKKELAQNPRFAAIFVGYSACANFGVAPAPKGFNDPVRSDVPTLVLGDEYDPVTPPDQSKHAAESLSRSTFVLFPGLGHGAVFSERPCPVAIFQAFLADPSARVDTSCVAAMGPPDWTVPS